MVNVQNQMTNRSNVQIKYISSTVVKHYKCMVGHREHKWGTYDEINSNISTLVRFNVRIYVNRHSRLCVIIDCGDTLYFMGTCLRIFSSYCRHT